MDSRIPTSYEEFLELYFPKGGAGAFIRNNFDLEWDVESLLIKSEYRLAAKILTDHGIPWETASKSI